MSDLLSRMRIVFAKTAPMRYTSHLDLHRTWERTFRRANIPLAYRHGFNPRPRLSLASALPLGFTSQEEILEVWIGAQMPSNEIYSSLVKALPPGLEISSIEEVDLKEPALQTQIESAEYRITFLHQITDLNARCQSLLDAANLPRQWKDKTYDLRPLILEIDINSPDVDGNQTIVLRLKAREGATGRPEEVISALGAEPEDTRIHRVRLIVLQ